MRVRPRYGVFALLAAIELGLLWLGTGAVVGVFEELRLRSEGTRIAARLLELRIMSASRYSTKSHEVRYEFTVRGQAYNRTDGTGRHDLWSTMEEPAWEEAKGTGTVEVLYLDDDPWVNRPVTPGTSPLADQATGAVLVAVFLTVAPLATWGGRINARQALAEGREGNHGPWRVEREGP